MKEVVVADCDEAEEDDGVEDGKGSMEGIEVEKEGMEVGSKEEKEEEGEGKRG